MLDMFGGENWTPNLNHPGLYQRAGMNHWSAYRWDPAAEGLDGADGNFKETGTIEWDELMCGSPFGAPEPC